MKHRGTKICPKRLLIRGAVSLNLCEKLYNVSKGMRHARVQPYSPTPTTTERVHLCWIIIFPGRGKVRSVKRGNNIVLSFYFFERFYRSRKKKKFYVNAILKNVEQIVIWLNIFEFCEYNGIWHYTVHFNSGDRWDKFDCLLKFNYTTIIPFVLLDFAETPPPLLDLIRAFPNCAFSLLYITNNEIYSLSENYMVRSGNFISSIRFYHINIIWRKI